MGINSMLKNNTPEEIKKRNKGSTDGGAALAALSEEEKTPIKKNTIVSQGANLLGKQTLGVKNAQARSENVEQPKISAPSNFVKTEATKSKTQSDVENYQKIFDDISKTLGDMRHINSLSGGYKSYSDKDIAVYTARLKNAGKILASLYEERGELDKMYDIRSRVSNALLAEAEESVPRSIGGVVVPKSIRQATNRKLDDAVYRAKADSTAKKYINKEYTDEGGVISDFINYFGANYSSAKLSEEANSGGFAYAQNPTAAREYYKDTAENIQNMFMGRNAAAVGQGGIISNNLAAYLPQLTGQIKNGVPLALVGMAIGGVVGVPTIGAELGYAAGAGRYSYEQMYGSSFNKLSKNTDFETAKKLARDEGLLSGGVESLDTLFDIVSLGGGTVLKALGKEAVEKIGKESIYKLLGKYAVNVLGEGGQEGLQELISIANERRLQKGDVDGGVIGLVEETISLINEIAKGANNDAFNRAKEAGIEGMKTAAVVGGTTLGVNAVAANVLSGNAENAQNESNTQKGDVSQDNDVYYLIEHDDNNVPFVVVENDVLDGLDTKQKEAKVREILSEKFAQGVKVGNELVQINKDTKREYIGSKYSRRIKSKKPTVYNDKLTALTEGDEVIKASRNYVGEGINHERKDNIKEFARGTVNLRIGEKDYSASVLVGTTTNDELLFYDLLNMTEVTIPTKKQKASNVNTFDGANAPNQMSKGIPSNSSIPQSEGNSNKNVDAFDEVIAMGTNEHAEMARKRIAQAQGESNNEVSTSIADVSDSGALAAAPVSLTPEQQELKGKFERTVGGMGYAVIAEPRRSVPEGTIGYVDFANKEIYISPGHFSESLLTHELTHVIDRGYNGKYVKSLLSFFKEKLADEWNEEYAKVKAKYEGISKKNADFTYNESTLEAETLAEMCSEFTTDEYIKKAASMEVGTIKQIAVFCKYIGAKLNSIFLDKSNAQKFKVASLKWQMALYKATKAGAVDGGSGIAYSGSSTKYDYRKSFDEQVEDYKKGTFPKNDSLLLGATPEVWRKAGFNALPVTINQTHVDYAINGTKDADHYIGETMLKQIPEAIKNPVAIIQSVTHPDRAVVLLKLQHNGKSVILPIEVDGYGTQNNISIDSNAVTSVFGKSNAIKQLSDAVTHTVNGSVELFYWNKKEALSLLQTPGLQLPSHLPQDGFIHSIRENGSKVKVKLENVTESQQFKRWFGKSKVVDENGVPKVVYHGTSKGGFSEFDTYAYLARYGLFGNGAYFTESKEIAEEYSHKGKGTNNQVYEVYLSVKNPLDMDATADAKKWNAALEREDIKIDIPEGSTNEDVLRLVEEELTDMDIPHYEGEEIVRNVFENMGYDGLTHIGGGRVNPDGVRHRVWIAFHPGQIKSVDNVGTFDGDNPDIYFATADDEVSAGSDSKKAKETPTVDTFAIEEEISIADDGGSVVAQDGANKNTEGTKAAGTSDKVTELEENIKLINQALEDEELSRTDRVALIIERAKYGNRLAELKGNTDDGKVSRRKAMLDEYYETGDIGVLPDRESLRIAEMYDKKKISELRKIFAELQEALRNQDGLSAEDVEELKMRRDAVITQLTRLGDNNTVLSEIEGVYDEFGVAEEPDHRWVNEISSDLADNQNVFKTGLYKTNDVERNFRHFFGKHFKKAYEKVLQPLYDSKKRYADGVELYSKRLKDEVVDGLGIYAGSRESEAVMWLGEGKRPLTKKELINLHGEEKANRLIAEAKAEGQSEVFVDYTYENCVKDFGSETADNIKKATEVFRKMYDELIADVNKTRAAIYPNNSDKLVKKRKDYFHHFQEMSQGFEGLKNILQTNIGIDPMLVGTSENTKPKSKWQGYMQERMGKRTKYDAVLGFLTYLPAAQYSIHIDPNIVNIRGLARELAFSKASEYGEHGNPNANVFIEYLQKYANHLAGKTISHGDRGWISTLGRKTLAVLSWLNNKTKVSAVLGNLNTVLTQFTNVLNMLGKIDHQSDAARGTIDALAGLNPDGKIAERYKESGFLKERFLGKHLDSYKISEWSARKILQTPGHFASWLLGFADEVGTRITWNAAYNEAQRKGVVDAVQYADNFTRTCVAGRGIGEVPLVFQSQVAKMFLPFRVEVLNNLNVQQDILFGKDDDGKSIAAGKRVKNLMQFFVWSAMANILLSAIKSDEFDPLEEAEEGYEENGVLGALLSVMEDYADGIGDPVVFDPIYDIVSGIYQGVEEGESAGGKIGKAALRTGQNIAGDLVSNNPFSTLAIGLLGADGEDVDTLFNGRMYSPGGLGMPLAGNVARAIGEVFDEDYLSALVAIGKGFLPMGTQLDRSFKGIYDYTKGYATTEAAYERMTGQEGNLKYLIEPSFGNAVRSALFGAGAFSGESDAFYNDKTRKFTPEEQAEILSHKDYESRKVTFDDILAMNVYDSERDERKQTAADEFFAGKEGTVLHSLYTSGVKEAIPYKNMAGDTSFTDQRTGKKYTLNVKADELEKLTAELSDKIAARFDRANKSDVFASLSQEEQVKYLNGVADAEYKQAKIKALYDNGQMGYEDYFRLESGYMESEARRDRVVYVNDTANYTKFNAADVVGQYISYSDFPVSEEGYKQLQQWRDYAATKKPDDVDAELMRLSNATDSDINVSGNPYGIISYTKSKVDYRIEMPDNQIYVLCDEVDKAVRSALSALFAKATYKNATAEVQKDLVASVKRDVRDGIKDKYKARYRSVKVDDFDRIVAMK